ncbi:hypothetical protein [uncultured Winogradskyella sp.]|uniref:hypothetical protein n=1 Tax=uncultured Winogradskyella sp. TaxID=395353 RepID=UPI002608E1B2|nr:hypothetical protein [uncultured Winogradskyella sp.]
MDTKLSPTYQKQFGKFWVLWFSYSNVYSVVDNDFKSVLDLYLASKSLAAFKGNLENTYSSNQQASIANNLSLYLRNCNIKADIEHLESLHKFNPTQRQILKHYRAGTNTFSIYFGSESIKNIIHPQIAHLETTLKHKSTTIFDVYLKDDELVLFKNQILLKAAKKQNFHFIQGKFFMHLLCLVHQKKETDWIGTFHGSAISDGHNAILCVGKSGKGKSTLCTLMAQKGFTIVADDVSPILSKDRHIYSNPSATSIKHGAFKALKAYVPNLENLTTTTLNASKGAIKYIPPTITNPSSYPCKAIVMVNYKEGSTTQLKKVSIKKVMETLIPDSWISHNETHAEQLLNWLSTLTFYELTYSDTESVTTKIKSLFADLKNHQIN